MGINQANRAPTAQKGPQDGGTETGSEGSWLKLAQSAYLDSTSYVDNNYRKGWDDSVRAFNNQHPGDSKYNAPAYEKRSRLYRPKTRSIIRKNEAAGAAAFFSTSDATSVEPTDPSDKMEVASSVVMKELLQYRLTKTIPWFQLVIGGLQEAQVMGATGAHIYWDYEAGEEAPEEAPAQDEYPAQHTMSDGAMAVEAPQLTLAGSGDPLEPPSESEYTEERAMPRAEVKPKKDEPVIDLIPLENLRFDPAASWIDPVNSSPYFIHMIPMYVMDVQEKMESGEWRRMAEGVIRSAASVMPDSTRTARGKDREDKYMPDSKSLSEYETVWIQRHIHRKNGVDWEFYTLGDQALLTTPKLLKESVLHGKRPYVIGTCILEAHKALPSSLPQLGKGLQDETNEVANQRIDNVKFVLNKKWFVRRGRDVDISGLMRNVPGGAVMMDDPDKDVREISWPDVTASAFEEQGRIDNDMNDLLGNFSAGQVMADKGIQGPARNMAILQQATGTLVEYLLRTFVETFLQPVLRQLVLLEQNYETDVVILGVAAKRAQLFKKFGIDEVTDDLLERELTLTVNVGMGATDPQMKLQKFLMAIKEYVALLTTPAPGLNLQEVGKEIFGNLGYSDGTRFFTNDDPNVAKLQDEIQKMSKVIQDLNVKLQEKQTVHQLKKEVAQVNAETVIKKTSMQEEGANQRNVVTHLRAIREGDQQRQQAFAAAAHKEDQTNLRHSAKHQLDLRNADKQREHDLIKLGITRQHGMQDAPQPAASPQ